MLVIVVVIGGTTTTAAAATAGVAIFDEPGQGGGRDKIQPGTEFFQQGYGGKHTIVEQIIDE